jgi:hypothetical protein
MENMVTPKHMFIQFDEGESKPDPLGEAWRVLVKKPCTPHRQVEAHAVLAQVKGHAPMERLLLDAVRSNTLAWVEVVLMHPVLGGVVKDEDVLLAAVAQENQAMVQRLLPLFSLTPDTEENTPYGVQADLLATAVHAAQTQPWMTAFYADPRWKQAEAVMDGQALYHVLAAAHPDEAIVAGLLPHANVDKLVQIASREAQARLQAIVMGRTALHRQGNRVWLDLETDPGAPTPEEHAKAWEPSWRALDRLSLHVAPDVSQRWVDEYGPDHFPRWQAQQRALQATDTPPAHRARTRRPRA